MTIFNNKTRCNVSQSTVTNNLSSCCCIKKGNSHVSLKQCNSEHPKYGENVSFRLDIN